MNFSPQPTDFVSLAFPKDRAVLTVGEVAAKWKVSDRHVVDLIDEGKLVAFDIAGRQEYVRVPLEALAQIARRLGVPPETLLAEVRATRPKLGGGRAFYRIPVVEGFTAFMRENHSLVVAGK